MEGNKRRYSIVTIAAAGPHVMTLVKKTREERPPENPLGGNLAGKRLFPGIYRQRFEASQEAIKRMFREGFGVDIDKQFKDGEVHILFLAPNLSEREHEKEDWTEFHITECWLVLFPRRPRFVVNPTSKWRIDSIEWSHRRQAYMDRISESARRWLHWRVGDTLITGSLRNKSIL